VGQIAGWQTLTSTHWAGYTFPTKSVTGVRAEWKEPNVSGNPIAEEFTWIGIGGWDYTLNNIIQIGTFAYFPSGNQINQGVWYEMVPDQQKAQFAQYPVSPGDQIFASIVQTQTSPQMWEMVLVDANTGATFDKVAPFYSLAAYPSFIIEDPNTGPPGPYGPFYSFPHWDTVTFSSVQVRVGGIWQPAATLYGDQVQMIQDGRTLATAGPLNGQSAFTVTQT
jgi:hypothetical protein